jgi:hypothetical protein
MSRLVEETKDLSSNVLASGLLVVHDTGGGGEDNVSELTRWQKLDDPLLEIGDLYVVSWADDTGLVETMHCVSNLTVFSMCLSQLTGRSIEQRSFRCGGHRPPRILRCSLKTKN